jgi:hypothetical protein
MSNKRDLKKAINNICTELFTECASAALYCNKEQRENFDALLSSVVLMRNNYISRISHPEPGMPQKAYFKKLINDFNKETTEFIDQITALS